MKNIVQVIMICAGCITIAYEAPAPHKKIEKEKTNEYLTHLVSTIMIAQDVIDGVHSNDFYTSTGAQQWLKNIQKKAAEVAKNIAIKTPAQSSPARISQDLAAIVTQLHKHLAVTPLVEPDNNADTHAWNEFRRRATRLNVDEYCVYVLTHDKSITQSGLVCRAKKGPRLRGVFWLVSPFDPTHPEKITTQQPIAVKAKRMAFLENATSPDNTRKPGTTITRVAVILPMVHQRVLNEHIKHQKRRAQLMHEQKVRQQPHATNQEKGTHKKSHQHMPVA